MGMVLGLVTVSDETIDRLHAFPPLVWKVLAPDDPEPFEAACKQNSAGGLIGRLLGSKPAPVPELPSDDRVDADLDKAWHGIHFLLTETAWEGDPPLNFLVQGGEAVGDIDVGYGPARTLKSADVSVVNAAVNAIDEPYLRSRFDPERMMELEIYPEIWDRDPSDDDTLGYCLEYFQVLKSVLADATKRRAGLLIYLS